MNTDHVSTKHTAIPVHWNGKRYYSLDAWCKHTLGRKCYKVALNAHMTCPNRDGSLDTRGCIFCSAGGSGDFAKALDDGQILTETASLHRTDAPCLIAYFQAYTNTYAPVSYLRQIYTLALAHPAVCGISIATRPDCLPNDVLELLSELKAAYPDKFIWIELGLQTIHASTAAFIRRGYALPCFEAAFRALKERDIPVIVHLILGLPGEDMHMLEQSIHYLNDLHPFGVKLQLLHILKGTDLHTLYLAQEGSAVPDSAEAAQPASGSPDSAGAAPPIRPLECEEYLAALIQCIRHLAPDIVIHRVTGDGPKELLAAPLWSLNKRKVLNRLHQEMKQLDALQGDLVPAYGTYELPDSVS